MSFTTVFRERADLPRHPFLRRMPRKGPHWQGIRTPFKAQFCSFPRARELTWSPHTTRWHLISNTANRPPPCCFWKPLFTVLLIWIAIGSFYSKLPNNTEKASIICKVLSLTGLFVLGHSRSSKQNLKASPPLRAKSGDDVLEPMKCTLTVSLRGTGMH